MVSLQIHPSKPSGENIEQISFVLKGGGIAILPTDTVYGIVCGVDSKESIERIYQIKNRVSNKPLPVFVNGLFQVNSLVDDVPQFAQRLMTEYWPGAITLVFSCHKPEYAELTRSSGKMGLRMPDSKLVLKLIESLGQPLASTSANISSKEPAKQISELEPEILNQVDIVVDGGHCGSGISSTVIDVSVTPPRILRPGEFSREELEEIGQVHFE